MSSTQDFNHLKSEKSLYLRQHAENPVFWRSYNEQAFKEAVSSDRPILLSIGYSSCHWCHVMAEESFQDQETADVINKHFIPIKVDREEMPDLDQYYQIICQLMNGGGGWPLNVFLTPDNKPFFCGTYFPKADQKNGPGFKTVLAQLAKAYKDDKQTVLSNAKQLLEAVKTAPKAQEKVEFEGEFPPAAAILNAVQKFADQENGGYGKAPKFPQFSFYEFAVEQILEGMIPEELATHVIKSVEQMLMGGIYDHARGGVHRYSVDEKWLVPHFEKMLYDQAGLLRVLSKLSLIYPSPLIMDAQIQTLQYLQNEMLSDTNFFFSAQDADSEGIEGLYFTFTKDEFIETSTRADEEIGEKIETILTWFKFEESGNFEKKLNVVALNPDKKEEYFKPENWELVRKIRQALLEERKKRIPPKTDNKGVASWNFMMAQALVDVVQYSKVVPIQDAASSLLKNVLEGIHKTFLSHGTKEERSNIVSNTTKQNSSLLFEDYVFFADFQLRLYEISGNPVFKQNGIETLIHVKENFFKDNVFYTRALEQESDRLFDNIPSSVFDQSYRSPLGTCIFLIRKWSLDSTELSEVLNEVHDAIEDIKHIVLQNPLGYGELLRALIYPKAAFKKISVPLAWLKDNKVQTMFPYFSSRFSVNYHDQESEKWEICNHNACELSGEGFDKFKEVFFPKQSGETSAES
ncbi:MAG: thioredoxin domain-containing protein [Bacteriovoracaceae bacterium]|nr:thioredoxin domain-containing protein [Bacteriovoracaceae bacterium]